VDIIINSSQTTSATAGLVVENTWLDPGITVAAALVLLLKMGGGGDRQE
jgi:hypothetical protein